MKKNFRKAVLLTLGVVSMGMFNSCKDNDLGRGIELEVKNLTAKNASLEAALQGQINELKTQLANIKSCECVPCPMTAEEVQKMIDNAIKDKLAAEDFATLIKKIVAEGGFQNAGQVEAAIAAYNAAHPGAGLSDEQVQELIDEAIASFTTPADVQALIDAAIAANQDGEEFSNLINEIIVTGGFQTAAQVQSAIAAYNAEHPGNLTAEQVQQMITLAVQNFATQNQLDQAKAELELAIASAQNTLNEAIEAAKGEIAGIKGEVDGVKTDVADVKAQQAALAEAFNNLNLAAASAIGRLEAAETGLAELKATVESLVSNVGALETAFTEKLTQQQEQIEALATGLAETNAAIMETLELWGPKLEEAVTNAAAAKAQAEINSESIELLATTLEQLADACEEQATASADRDAALQNALDSLATEMNEFASKQALSDVLKAAEILHLEAIGYTKSIENWAVAQFGELQEKFQPLEDKVAELNEKVAELNGQVEANTQAIQSIQGYLKKLITGIIIQGTTNPAFASFSFPWGVQSNMLIGYYGEAVNDIYFPTAATANYIYKETALTAKDAEMLGSSVESFFAPSTTTLIEETEGNAGKVYLTVNPSNVNFEGTTFSLVNSQDEESPVKLGALKKSNATLTFGITRADNGFYEAPASFTADNIPAIGMSDIANDLKDIAKQALNIRKGFNVSKMAKDMLDVVSVFNRMEANGVKAAWNTAEGPVSVYSKYEIAAVGLKPLSYSFLYDVNVGTKVAAKLPEINPITDALLNDLIDLDALNLNLNFDLSGLNFHVEDITATIPAFNIQFEDVEVNRIGGITADVRIPLYAMVEEHPGTNDWKLVNDRDSLVTVNIDPSALDASIIEIVNKINESMEHAGADLSAEIHDQLVSSLSQNMTDAVRKIEDEVNDLLQNQLSSQINGQLSEAMQDVFDQVKEQIGQNFTTNNGIISKVNKGINLYNDFVGRIESGLNNLNSKLQVAAMYQDAKGDLHLLSTRKGMPTVFKGEGDAQLFLTSQTAEVVAPAFKKFIAVTNVFKGTDSAQKGNADCVAALNEVNAGQYFNTVFSGNRHGVLAENLKPGYTYEIFYSGLDYSGKISARKFYIKVK